MKRLVLFVVALVFAFSTTVMAAPEKAVTPAGDAKVEAKATDEKAVKKVKKEKKAKKTKKAAEEKKADEKAPAAK